MTKKQNQKTARASKQGRADDVTQMTTKNNDEKSIFGNARASTPTTASAAAVDPYNSQKPGKNVDDALKND